MSGGYYGPGGSLGLVGPTTFVRPPRRARDAVAAARLWAAAEQLTGEHLPAARHVPDGAAPTRPGGRGTSGAAVLVSGAAAGSTHL